jgi:hypothetical protein
MKRIIFALAFVALTFAAPCAKAETDVSINFFYDNLAGDGDWIDVGDYGYCWQPRVAVSLPTGSGIDDIDMQPNKLRERLLRAGNGIVLQQCDLGSAHTSS